MKSDNYYGMLNDIQREPALLRSLYENRREITREFVTFFQRHSFKKIYLTGSGSPLYAGIVLKYAAIRLLGLDAAALPAMLLLRHEGFPLQAFSPEEILLFCPAESGRAKGQVNVARQAKTLGIPIVCTTWNAAGPLAELSDLTLIKPEKETGMPTTMGQVMAIYLGLLCFLEAGLQCGRITTPEYDRYMAAMERVPQNIETSLKNTAAWFDAHQNEIMASSVYRMIGYGANIGTAEEATLKFMETNMRPALFFELEECMHGPLVGVKKEDVIFIFATEDGQEKTRARQLWDVMQACTDHCYLVHSAQEAIATQKEMPICTGNVEFVDAMEFLPPMQLLSFLIADHLGKDTGIHEPFAMMRKLETSYR